MSYLYRYDSLRSHLKLHGDCLRARFWSHSKKQSHPHAMLIAAESTLPEGHGIFRISFWKDEASCRRFVPCSGGAAEPYVVQRVRADHPFFNGFRRDVDDYLPDSAWLFWKIDRRECDQEWSTEGISKTDLEVLDLDGKWKPYANAELTAPAHDRYGRLGFDPVYYVGMDGRQASAYFAAQALPASSMADFAVLILEPADFPVSILVDLEGLQSIFEQIQNRIDIPASHRLRLFVVQEAVYTFEHRHIAEVPIRRAMRRATTIHWLARLLPWRRYEPFLAVSDEYTWWSTTEDQGRALSAAFHVPSPADSIARYSKVVARTVSPRNIQRFA